jgi:hypothetical protein
MIVPSAMLISIWKESMQERDVRWCWGRICVLEVADRSLYGENRIWTLYDAANDSDEGVSQLPTSLDDDDEPTQGP